MRRPVAGCAFILAVLLARPASAQQYIRLGSPLDDYARLLELDSGLVNQPLLLRSPSLLDELGPIARDTAHPWHQRYPFAAPAPHPGRLTVEPLDPELVSVYNSAYPRGVNDGAMWDGRGETVALSGGARVRWGPLTAVLDPTVIWDQNRDFVLPPDSGLRINRAGLSPYAYPFANGGIDWPERFGNASFGTFDWGQSGVRVTAGPATVGFSTENMWWGPAFQNPIIMSNNAPGFPHLDIGTARPVWIGIGTAEIRILWGRLRESAYFDTVSTNNGRLFSGVVMGFAPRWIPGLTLGLTRVFYEEWDSLVGAADFLDIFQTIFKANLRTATNRAGDDYRDQLLSIVARWTLPRAGFQAYVEWARNDHSWDLHDFLLEPDHSRAYTIGFQQVFGNTRTRWRLRGESTTLGRDATTLVRGNPVYYEHFRVIQGYTNDGQILGAGIGPGGQSEILALDRFGGKGRIGLVLQRVRFNDDAYYANFDSTQGRTEHDVELSAGLSGTRFVGPVDISAGLTVSRELNRYDLLDNKLYNAMVELKARWRLGSR
jgi:hypothetical protein